MRSWALHHIHLLIILDAVTHGIMAGLIGYCWILFVRLAKLTHQHIKFPLYIMGAISSRVLRLLPALRRMVEPLMAGNTGKMTREAIAARGPRMVLAHDLNSNDLGKLVYYREDQKPAGKFAEIARSYSMSYLKRLEKVNSL